MMSNETEMDRTAVIDHYAQVERDGGRNFLLYWQGQLMGDADLRHIDHAAGTAEFAILIGERPRQGRGFGARFAVMVHALAFGDLRLDRIYVSIIPANRASLRLFEKIGYSPDVTPAARRYIDEPDDVTLSLERTAYARLHAEAAGQLVMTYA
jgi:RimJ/RimL family protein N-acetyltransferase